MNFFNMGAFPSPGFQPQVNSNPAPPNPAAAVAAMASVYANQTQPIGMNPFSMTSSPAAATLPAAQFGFATPVGFNPYQVTPGFQPAAANNYSAFMTGFNQQQTPQVQSGNFFMPQANQMSTSAQNMQAFSNQQTFGANSHSTSKSLNSTSGSYSASNSNYSGNNNRYNRSSGNQNSGSFRHGSDNSSNRHSSSSTTSRNRESSGVSFNKTLVGGDDRDKDRDRERRPLNSSSSRIGFQGSSHKRNETFGGHDNSSRDRNEKDRKTHNYIPRGPLHYCEVCKISCAGPQTYKEHLEGQKHKKKEQQLKMTATQGQSSVGQSMSLMALGGAVKPGQKTFYCELCDVTCTSADTYNAHARGAKHIKCVKLYQKMNKPIPAAKEVIVNAAGEEPTVVTHTISSTGDRIVSSSTSANGASSAYATNGSKTPVASSAKDATTLKSLSAKVIPMGMDPNAEGASATSTTYVEDGLLKDECDPDPIGAEYIEENRDADNKLIEFNCKLCDCKFNDPYAKDMHLKGRRHRLMYKRKVNPELEVDLKPGFRNKRLMEDRARTRKQREELHRRLAQDHATRMQMRHLEEELYFRLPGATLSSPYESWDDRHILGKHNTIYPTDSELEAVQMLVGTAEKVLKMVSDQLALEDMKDPEVKLKVEAQRKKDKECGGHERSNEDNGKSCEKKVEQNGDESGKEKAAVVEEIEAESKEESSEKSGSIDSAYRQVKGVMRIGCVAKGLLLRGDKLVELAVLCQERPTKTLLARVFKCLSQLMAEVAPDHKYSYEVRVQDCAIIVTSQDTFRIQLKASLTSAAVNATDPSSDPEVKANPNLLSKQRCLAVLAELRRAKWFQSRVTCVPSSVVVIRIVKHLMRQSPSWDCLTQWGMEVLVEKVLSTSATSLSPGDALRRLLECIAGGVLCPAQVGTGVIDPCEDMLIDVFRDLKLQQRDDVTLAAQHALRQLVFKQIHKLLGMELIPPPTPAQIRKRRMEQMDLANKEKAAVAAKKEKTELTPSESADSQPMTAEKTSNESHVDSSMDDSTSNEPVLPNNANENHEKEPSESDPVNSIVHLEKDSSSNHESVSKTTHVEVDGSMEGVPDSQVHVDSAADDSQGYGYDSEYQGDYQTDSLVDPGGEAAYEAMSYEDPYESYYGPLPFSHRPNPMDMRPYGNPRFYGRPWRSRGSRGSFYRPW